MAEPLRYPISEIFCAPQGEGTFAGQLQNFIRLAGCSVGKPFSQAQREQDPALRALPIYTEQCGAWDGRTFFCDTDFRAKERLTVAEIIARLDARVRDVCITGGEPLMHDLGELSRWLFAEGKRIHIETSGTVAIPGWMRKVIDGVRVPRACWITVSPKRGVLDDVLQLADEVKLLVDESFPIDQALLLMSRCPEAEIFLQPINGEFEIDQKNLARCVELQKQMPRVRISVQLHKLLHTR